LLQDKAEEVQAQDAKRRQLHKKGLGAFRPAGGDVSLEHFLNGDETHRNNDDDDDDVEMEEILKSKPIADFFEEATVMFADLVGFTGK
jgi:class 3 adenylate cyclase